MSNTLTNELTSETQNMFAFNHIRNMTIIFLSLPMWAIAYGIETHLDRGGDLTIKTFVMLIIFLLLSHVYKLRTKHSVLKILEFDYSSTQQLSNRKGNY